LNRIVFTPSLESGMQARLATAGRRDPYRWKLKMTTVHKTSVEANLVIDLTDREDVPDIGASGDRKRFIQREALERLETLLNEQIESARSDTDGPRNSKSNGADFGSVRNRRHNAIAVLGGRGSGKTTFILNALELLLSSRQKRDVVHLGVIDPTLVEAKEQVLVTVISRIKEKVDQCHRGRRRDMSYDRDESSLKDFEAVEGKLKALAEGLCLLPGIGRNQMETENWENPQFVMQNGLQKARSGLALEYALHEYIESSLNYIGREAFILAFDDIDTNFTGGWPVLEMLRKYITSPKLIIILSGDFSLYSLLVRDRQWDMLRDLHQVDVQRQQELNDQVDRLESQYLQKVIKPTNRIELLPLSYHWEDRARRSGVAISLWSGGKATLEEMMQKLARYTLFSAAPADVEMLALLILRQPVRTVMHVLRALDQNKTVPHELVPNDTSQRKFHAALSEIFLTELQSMGLSAERVTLVPLTHLARQVGDFLTHNQIWQDGFRLKPDFKSDTASLAMLCLAARFAQGMRQTPSLIIDYFINVGLIRDMLVLFPELLKEPARLFAFVGLDRLEPASSVAARMVPVIRYDTELAERRSTFLGTIAISYRRRHKRSAGQPYGTKEHFGLEEREFLKNIYINTDRNNNRFVHQYIKELKISGIAKLKLSNNGMHVGFLFNTWKRLETNMNAAGSALLRIATVEVYDHYGFSSAYLSVLPLIGIIGQLLDQGRAMSLLRELGSDTRSYQQPTWANTPKAAERAPTRTAEPTPSEDDDDDASSDGAEFSDNELKNFSTVLDQWSEWAVEKLKASEPLPPYVLARVWTRFFETLKKIDEDVPMREKYAGWLLHRQIAAFLNALLIEEALHRLNDALADPLSNPVKVSLFNPVKTDRFFLRTLRAFDDQHWSKVPLFRVLFSCPLWTPYLESEKMSQGDSTKGEEASIFALHCARWSEFLPKDRAQELAPDKVLRVTFEVRLGGVRQLEFSTLYPLLNSLIVIGRNPWKPKPAKGEGSEREDNAGYGKPDNDPSQPDLQKPKLFSDIYNAIKTEKIEDQTG
jgi:hypothetical protein